MLADSLKALQKQTGLKQKRFAASIGIAQSTLSRIYAGKRRMGMDVVAKVVAVYPEFALAVGQSLTPANIAKEIGANAKDIEAA